MPVAARHCRLVRRSTALKQILGNLVSKRPHRAGGAERRRHPDRCQPGKLVRIDGDDAARAFPADPPGLFEAFFTTRPEGTGLGLPIARRLAEMNGGALELAEQPSPLGGARFTLTLPANEP